MDFLKKTVLKMVLPMVIHWLVDVLEKELMTLKSDDKKADIIKFAESFLITNGLGEYLDKTKLEKLVDVKITEYINK